MRVQVRRERAHAQREDGGEGRCQTHHQQRVQTQDLPVRHRRGDLGEAGQCQHDADRSGQHQRAAAESVVQLSDRWAQQAHGQAARHQQQAGLQWGQAAQVLQVEGQQDHRAHHRQERDAHEDQGQGEGADPEGAQVHQGGTGALQFELAEHEDRDEGGACQDDADGRAQVGGAFSEQAQAVDQAAEAEGRHGRAEPVDGAHLRFADVGQLAQAEVGHGARDRQDRHEQQAPGAQLQDQAGHCRAQGRSHRDRERDVAHHAAAVLLGHHGHQRRHQQRHHHGGARGLHDSAEQQHREDRRGGGDGRSRHEHAHRDRVALAGGDPLQEPAGDRDDGGHGEHERGGDPLRGLLGDLERLHQARDRVDHEGLVEDHHEGGQHQQAHHQGCPGRLCGRAVLDRCRHVRPSLGCWQSRHGQGRRRQRS